MIPVVWRQRIEELERRVTRLEWLLSKDKVAGQPRQPIPSIDELGPPTEYETVKNVGRAEIVRPKQAVAQGGASGKES